MKLSHLFGASNSSTGTRELLSRLTTPVLLLAYVVALPGTGSAANVSSTDFNVDITYTGGFLTNNPGAPFQDSFFFFDSHAVTVPFSGSVNPTGTGSAVATGTQTVSGGDNSFLAEIETSTDASATGGGSRYTAQRSVEASLAVENRTEDELGDPEDITLEFDYDATWLFNLTNMELDNIPRGTIGTFILEALVNDGMGLTTYPIYDSIFSVAPNSTFMLDHTVPNPPFNPLSSGTVQIPLLGGDFADITFKIRNTSAGKVDMAPVPAPSAMLLMGTGLVGLIGWRLWSTKTI